MSTPRQRVLDALSHRQPSRVPFSWGFCCTPEMSRVLEDYLGTRGVDWIALRDAVDDVTSVNAAYIGPPRADGNTSTGIWGAKCKTVNYGGGHYQEFTDFPLAAIQDPAALAGYPWPSPDWYDYDSLRTSANEQNPGQHRASKIHGGNVFEIYCWMTGLEQALMNLVINPDLVRAALGYITDFFEQRLRRSLEVAGDMVDIVFLADDLGGQHGLLMSGQIYRRILQPFHRRLTQCAHQTAPHAHCMFHSDGAVFDVLQDLVDAGITVLEAVQIDVKGMDPQRLKETFGNRLSFHGAISVQQLLPYSDADTVTSECRRLIDVLGRGGGYIAAPSHAIQVGTPPQNVLAMLRAVLGEVEYERAMAVARI